MQRNLLLLKNHGARPGGLEKYTLRLARAFIQSGCSVTLVTSGEAKNLPTGLATISHPCKSLLSYRRLLQFDQFCEKTVREMKPDLIFGLDRTRRQTHLRAGNGVHAAYLEKRAKVDPFFKRLSFAFNPLHKTILSIEKQAFESADLAAIFTNSAMVKEEILNHYKTSPHKIFVIHNGVEWQEMERDFLSWQAGKKQLAEELKLDAACAQLLFIGHNFRRKGLDRLLAALSTLPTRAFHLSVVGFDKNQREFERLADSLGIKNQVTFFGRRSDIMRFYQLADLLIIPSLYDPFANVTIEALAMGLFVVSSTSNGGHEVLTEKSGLAVDIFASLEPLTVALSKALEKRKTEKSAKEIRESVRHLDFSEKLKEITQRCLF